MPLRTQLVLMTLHNMLTVVLGDIQVIFLSQHVTAVFYQPIDRSEISIENKLLLLCIYIPTGGYFGRSSNRNEECPQVEDSGKAYRCAGVSNENKTHVK